ncbi:amino acid ABC transporter ATP-binding protein [Brachyspira catarrhinii]|uniref:Amino acid ABC transporter ATP-binding protein n=1 Tax=Brachyspira catarrhinii TaxID=2528966 RepID=A0ABY2TPR9_9SPIR|nr:amino acid ABC transporter ATP-binding protein [Brachyspira catarrhinii]TKZ28164.1 amino acid ABC transporter ATP-binding protein [Brachyspira catarrhinii]
MLSEINLKVVDLKKSYKNIPAINGVSFDIHKGDILSIIGPSGAGKSSLLRNIIQIESPDYGEVYIDGEILFSKTEDKKNIISHADMMKRKEKMGMIFQHFNLFPHKTALENIIEAPIIVKKINREEAIEEALKLLDRVGLKDKSESYPNELSGGQKQRVAIARALAMKPAILLCDEPTSALDPELIGEVLSVLKELAKEKMTMIVVSHEISFVRELSTNIAFMDGGKIIAMDGSEDFFNNQKNERIIDFLNKIYHK